MQSQDIEDKVVQEVKRIPEFKQLINLKNEMDKKKVEIQGIRHAITNQIGIIESEVPADVYKHLFGDYKSQTKEIN